jgi:hypothetical protein
VFDVSFQTRGGTAVKYFDRKVIIGFGRLCFAERNSEKSVFYKIKKLKML